MTFQITHPFVTSQAQTADSRLVSRSAWNESHSVYMQGPGVLGRPTPTSGEVIEIAAVSGTDYVLREVGGQILFAPVSYASIPGLSTALSILSSSISGLASSIALGTTNIPNAALAFMQADLIKGRYGTSGVPQDLSAASVRTILGAGGGISNISYAFSAFQINSQAAYRMLAMSGYFAASLLSISSLGSSFAVYLRNIGSRRINIATSGTETIDGAASIPIFPRQGFALFGDGNSAAYTLGRPDRWYRSNGEGLWVSAAASANCTDDGFASNAPMTLNQAQLFARQKVDFGGANFVVSMLAGTYSGALQMAGHWVGHHNIEFVGDSANPTSVLMNPASGEVAWYVSDYCRAVFRYMSISGNLGSQGIKVEQAGVVGIDRTTHGNASIGIGVGIGGMFKTNGPITVGGSMNVVLQASYPGARIEIAAAAISIPTAMSFAQFAAAAEGAGILIDPGGAVTGAGYSTCTGQKFLVSKNGTINSGGIGLDAFPGNTAGDQMSGGRYS